MGYDDESQNQNRHVSKPWMRGRILNVEWCGDVPMFQACDKEGKIFAVLEVHLALYESRSKREELSDLEKEIETLTSLAHDNIIQYMGYEKDQGQENLYVFREPLSDSPLSSVYKDFELSEKQVSGYTRHILKGVEYIHHRRIVHRDIRCGNILVDGNGTCRIADFGLAKQLICSLSTGQNSKTGLTPWMAPEAFDKDKRLTFSADIWSLGCTVIEMASRAPPYGLELGEKAIAKKLVNGETPPIPDKLSEDAKDFIKQCLQIDPNNRPTASQLLQHPFIAPPNESSKSSDIQVTFEEILRSIAQELESYGAEVYHLNGEWMGSISAESREMIEAKFWDSGYLKTVATDIDIYYEKITLGIPREHPDISDNSQPAYTGVAEVNASSNQQRPEDNSSQISATTNPSSQLFNNNDNVNNPEVSEANIHIEEPTLMGCGHDCQLLPLQVTMRGSNCNNVQHNSSSSLVSQETDSEPPINGYYVDFEAQGGNTSGEKFQAELSLSCCIDKKKLCIKIPYMTSQINEASLGTALKEMRVTVGVTIGNQKIQLSSNGMDEMGRVIQQGKVSKTYIPLKHEWSFKIAPSFSFGPGSCGGFIGEVARNPRSQSKTISFEKGEELPLVILRRGSRACRGIKMNTVLVLQRNLPYTWLTEIQSESTAIVMNDSLNPLMLTGEFSPPPRGKTLPLKISCCVQLETSFLDALNDGRGKEKIANAYITKGERNFRTITCDHVIFEGIIHPADPTTTV